MGRKDKKAKDEGKSKKQKTAHDPNSNHKASPSDGWDVLPNVVRHSGLLEAFVTAKQIDLLKRQGIEALKWLMFYHQVSLPGGKINWEAGPASWMVNAIQSAKKKDPVKFLGSIMRMFPSENFSYEVAMDAAEFLDQLGMSGTQALREMNKLDRSGKFSLLPGPDREIRAVMAFHYDRQERQQKEQEELQKRQGEEKKAAAKREAVGR